MLKNLTNADLGQMKVYRNPCIKHLTMLVATVTGRRVHPNYISPGPGFPLKKTGISLS